MGGGVAVARGRSPLSGSLLASPAGTFWSVVMMLEHSGENAAAERVTRAVEAVTANPRPAYWRSGRQSHHEAGDRWRVRSDSP